MNLRLGRWAKLLAPAFGSCLRCETPWRFVRYHDTSYGDNGRGCFPLCEKCWTDLGTPEERMPFYALLLAIWGEDDASPIAVSVRAAVLAGR